MIDPSHYVTLSFFLFVGYVLYKRFFGLPEAIDSQIKKIESEISNAHTLKKQAFERLETIRLNLQNIEIEVNRILESAEKDAEVFIKIRSQDLLVYKNEMEDLHQRHIKEIKASYETLYLNNFVNILMNKVIEKIQNENSAETMDKHLKTAVMMLSGDSFNFNIKEDHF